MEAIAAGAEQQFTCHLSLSHAHSVGRSLETDGGDDGDDDDANDVHVADYVRPIRQTFSLRPYNDWALRVVSVGVPTHYMDLCPAHKCRIKIARVVNGRVHERSHVFTGICASNPKEFTARINANFRTDVQLLNLFPSGYGSVPMKFIYDNNSGRCSFEFRIDIDLEDEESDDDDDGEDGDEVTYTVRLTPLLCAKFGFDPDMAVFHWHREIDILKMQAPREPYIYQAVEYIFLLLPDLISNRTLVNDCWLPCGLKIPVADRPGSVAYQSHVLKHKHEVYGGDSADHMHPCVQHDLCAWRVRFVTASGDTVRWCGANCGSVNLSLLFQRRSFLNSL